MEAIPSLQEQAVTSMITSPVTGQVLTPGVSTVKGYAYSGGGRGIIRVDVSADGGNTWQTAELTEGKHQPLHRAWAWTFWETDIDLTPNNATTPEIDNNTVKEKDKGTTVQLICKAIDASHNVQPDSVAGIWNLRGINNTAWHRKQIEVVADDDDGEE